MSQLHEQSMDRRNKPGTTANGTPITRIKSTDLFRQMRELEIDHGGRIYKLRLTQLNKLILTA
ncbi:hemin uptake protein HemP [Herbaspirillum chlorophenolicum]|jgi:hemin uptake protein HemP|uniref:hemin uptake protein HemP n=1 Tax=Herbaspirillum chlorophenolicum TaxID=211589 RepID=UPI00067E26C7|nr:hemin uptake protein HemP [Herbaspirillum chlorophenolicum]